MKSTQPSRPFRKAAGYMGTLLLCAVLLLFVQSVWAAGYRPHRHLADWQLQQDTAATPDKAAAISVVAAPSNTTTTTKQTSDKTSSVVQSTTAAAKAGHNATQNPVAAVGVEGSEHDNSESDIENGLAATTPAAVARNGTIANATASLAAQSSQDSSQTAAAKAASASTSAASAASKQSSNSSTEAAAVAKEAGQPAQATAAAKAVSPLANMPYDLDKLADVQSLFKAHTEWQTKVLQERKRGVPAVKVETGLGHGLGNRLPGVGTGYALALLTGRLFFLQSTLHEHLELPFPCVWEEFEALYDGVDRCDLGHFSKFVNPELKFCGGAEENTTAPLLMQPSQFDYMLPMFQINPVLKPYFNKFFPDGEVYNKLARYLFKPKPVLQKALKPYKALSKACLVGMHLRTKKPGTSASPEEFAAIARAVATNRPGSIFVAADDDVYKMLQDELPGREVWWNKDAARDLRSGNTTAAGNPGTELNAMVDVMLLSKCKNIILTPSSSMGGVAAALGGVLPVYANHGSHSEPFTNPWFWKSVTSEPCFVKASTIHRVSTALAQQFRREHPLSVYHNQCHYEPGAIGWPDHTWECTGTDCREFK